MMQRHGKFQMLASSKKGSNNHEARIIVSPANFFLVFGRAIVYVHLTTIRAPPGIKTATAKTLLLPMPHWGRAVRQLFENLKPSQADERP
jgi:hypothetical protein